MKNIFKDPDLRNAIFFCIIFLSIFLGVTVDSKKEQKTVENQKIETFGKKDNKNSSTNLISKKIKKNISKEVSQNKESRKLQRELEKAIIAESKIENPKINPERGIMLDLDYKIQKALDEEKFEDLQKIVPQASICRSADTRMNMVNSLSWFGFKAIPELMVFAGDPDDEVSNDALDTINSALVEAENSKDVADSVAVIMKSRSILDDSYMEDISMHLNMMDDSKIAISAIIDIMENGSSDLGKKWANDSYKFILGIDEDYTTKDVAEKALKEYISENGLE